MTRSSSFTAHLHADPCAPGGTTFIAIPNSLSKNNAPPNGLRALLTEFGLEVHTGIGNTGVVGVLQKGGSERALGLRADMDALLIQEQNSFRHRSIHDGKMHACGHDGHTSMLLGAARYLATSGDFDGRVVFIFNPRRNTARARAR